MAVYEININANSNGNSGKNAEDKTKVPSKEDKTPNSIANSLLVYVASNTVQPFIQQTSSFVSNQITMVTGRKSVSEKINFGMNMAQKATSIVSTASAGAVLGKTMGIGGGAGVALGLAVFALSNVVTLAFQYAEFNTQKQLQNVQTQLLQSRVGTNVNFSREGN